MKVFRDSASCFMVAGVLLFAASSTAGASVPDSTDVAPVVKTADGPPPAPQGCTDPVNDDCAAATVIAALPYNVVANTECATDEAGEPQSTCTIAANSIWYRYTATATEIVTVSLVGSDFDTTLMIWQGTCGAFTEVACNDDFDGLQSEATFVTEPGITYYFQIAGFDGDTGNVTLNVTSIGLADCPTFDVSTSFSGTTSQLGRIFRDGIPTTCANKPYPGIFNPATTYNYEVDLYPNPSPVPACVVINFDPNSGATPCGTNAHMSAYAGSYDPLDQATNFLGDVGSSVTQPFQVTVPAATDLVLVTTNTASQAVCTFSYELIGMPCYTAPLIQEIPTVDRRGIAALVVLLGLAAFFVLRRSG